MQPFFGKLKYYSMNSTAYHQSRKDLETWNSRNSTVTPCKCSPDPIGSLKFSINGAMGDENLQLQ